MITKLITKLEIRFPISRPNQSGIFSGDRARVSSTTVGYRPTHTAIEVLVSDGGGASLPCSSKANQLPKELSMVLDWKSANLSPSVSRSCRSFDTSHASRSAALSYRYSAVHSS